MPSNKKVLYAFVGFQTLKDVQLALQNSKFVKVPIDKQIDFFNFTKEELNKANYPVFEPCNDMFYLYFVEKHPPKKSMKLVGDEVDEKQLFGIEYVRNIQRNYILADYTGPYIFLGFDTISHIKQAINSRKLWLQVKRGVFYWNFSTDDLKYDDFYYNPSLSYFYFKESQPFQCSFVFTNTTMFGISNAVEYQRCFYLPGTLDLYTFVGFREASKMYEEKRKLSFSVQVYFHPRVVVMTGTSFMLTKK